MTRSMTAFGSNHQRMQTQVIIRVSKLKEGRMNPQKEVDTMKVPLIELQMCQLKMQRQAKKSTNQKRKLSFVWKKISDWKSDFSLLIFCFLINNFASLKLKCAFLFLGFLFPRNRKVIFQEFETTCLFLIFCNIRKGIFSTMAQLFLSYSL